MSLFPAYDPGTLKECGDTSKVDRPLNFLESKYDHPDLSWLQNTSYSAVASESKNECNKEESAQSKSENLYNRSKAKSKKKKSGKKERCSKHKDISSSSKKLSSTVFEDDRFYEDKKQEKGNFLVETLYRPAIPRYNKNSRYFKIYKLMKNKIKKNKKIKRYYFEKNVKIESCLETNEDTYTKEEELSKVTEDFNKKLAENPRDVDTWLEYVRFQNTVLEFENTYRNNPTAGGARVTSERQLAILERALQSNPANEQLLSLRLQLLELTLPPEQVADECCRALVQDPGCVPLWRALVRTSRNNMARCVVPAVLREFSKALTRLGQLRVHRPPATVDRDILGLTLECGLFLQQAGLWEQLVKLLQMYLSLNLTASGQFTLPAQPQQDLLREQEDSVLGSGLPLSVLWLRVEKLRAAYHFLPLADCEADPQRVVFSEDLAGLLQPMADGELRLQLVASVFLLLKVPLLPTRHCALQCLGLLQIPSAINNIETLLAAVYPDGFSSSSCRYLSGCVDLTSEPQFVREAPGQTEFLSSVISLLQQCAELLPAADAVIIHVWLLRLYTLLCRLHQLQLGAAPVAKQARNYAKKLLKQSQFRENLLLYSEYAMMERATGDLDKACKVLETATTLPSPSHNTAQSDVQRLLLTRRLVECLLLKDYPTNKDSAVRVLLAVQQTEAGWQQHTTALVQQSCLSACEPPTLTSTLTPQLVVEWLACHSLYLSLTRSVWDATALLQQSVDTVPHEGATLGSVWVEQLYEVMTNLLYLHTVHTKTGFTVLRATLVKALKIFPNNLTLLNTLASLETIGGSPLWKLVSLFPSSVPLARLVLVFVARYRVSQLISEGGGNYLRNLLRQFTAEEQTGQCPLVWRVYLQLEAAQEAGARVKAVFYKALQACPWVKTLYLDAVKFLPEELPEVQDLLIEKELRIHTTPEELEILRE